MLDKYKVYNLRRKVLVKFPNHNKPIVIVPRMPTDIGWKEVDITVSDFYKDYRNYLEQHGIKYIQSFNHQVPTFKTRMLLALEKIIRSVGGE
jgi:hypothetical protein